MITRDFFLLPMRSGQVHLTTAIVDLPLLSTPYLPVPPHGKTESNAHRQLGVSSKVENEARVAASRVEVPSVSRP